MGGVGMYEVIDLRTGKVVKVAGSLEEAKKGLPEGLYEIKYNGEFVEFYSIIREEHRTWI